MSCPQDESRSSGHVKVVLPTFPRENPDLTSDGRCVYSDGYLYVVDPGTGAVTKVIDTYSH